MILNEGLKELDLKGLVLPTLSIDEYESKIDQNAIVVGFYVLEQDPANDLNRFIQKSHLDIIDTDVSPAPDEDGNFMVFVEFYRDKTFIPKIIDLISSLENLVDIKKTEWKFTTYKHKSKFPFNEKELKVLIDLKGNELKEFLSIGNYDQIYLDENRIQIQKNNNETLFEFIDFGNIDFIFEKYKLKNQSLYSNQQNKNLRILESYFSPFYNIFSINQKLVILDESTNQCLILKE